MSIDVLTSTIPADGGRRAVPPERLQELRTQAEALARDIGEYGKEETGSSHDVRFAHWAGQSPDGRQWSKNGIKPRPFEGAPDSRVRLADFLVNLKVETCLEALRRAEKSVQGMEPGDDKLASRLNRVLDFVLKNRLGRSFDIEKERLLQWMFGDKPGVAVMGVYWHTEQSLRLTTTTLPELLAKAYPPETPAGPAEIAEFVDIFNNPGRKKEAADLIRRLKPFVTAARAARMVGELAQTGEAQCPEPYISTNQVCVKAHRYNDDFFMPRNTSDMSKARLRIVRMMMSDTELQDGVVRYGFRQAFVDELLGDKRKPGERAQGRTLFPLTMTRPHEDDVGGTDGQSANQDANAADGLYEVLFAYYRATNEDGISALYVTAFNPYCDEPATDEAIVPYDPFVWFSTEYLSRYLVESRGVPELVVADQAMLKMFRDSFGASAQMRAVPPMEVAQDRPNQAVIIAPLAKNKVTRPGDIKFMEMPEYPREVVEFMRMIVLEVYQLHGVPHPEIPEGITQVLIQGMINRFMGGMLDVHKLILKVCQLYMPDAELQRVLGAGSEPIALSWEEIQGEYDVALEFDSRELSMEYMTKLGDVISKVLVPMDTEGSIRRARLVNRLFRRLSPTLADEVVDDSETANLREIQDEEQALVAILAGIEPQRKPGNHALRLRVIDESFAKNPEMEQKLTPVSRQILEARVKFHAQQVEQERNKQIGRDGSPRALDAANGMPAALAGLGG